MAMKRAYRAAFRGDLKAAEAVTMLRRDFKDLKEAKQLADFLVGAKRGVCQDASKRRRLKRQGSGGAEDIEGAEG